MPLEIIQIPALSDNYIYLLHDMAGGATAVVDPAEAAPVMAALQQRGWRLDAILNTHHHHDHTGGNMELARHYSCAVYGYGPDAARIPALTHPVEDGDRVRLGEAEAEVLFVPGHTLGHIAYHFADSQALFCGDTLFSLGCGRLFEGTAEQMHHSLSRLSALPGETRVYCAHEYTEANGRFALHVEPQNLRLQQRMQQVRALRAQARPTVPSTLEEERAANPFLRADSAEIRGRLRMPDASAPEVFATLRRMKNEF